MNQPSVMLDFAGNEQRGRGPAMSQAEMEALAEAFAPKAERALSEADVRNVLEEFIDFGVELGVFDGPDDAPSIDAFIEGYD